MPKDYYEVLGVQRSASQDDIKRAFRKKAHELHPDKGGDEKAFKEVNEAYQVLGDQRKRSTYDQFGHAAFQGAGAGPGGFSGGFGGFNGQGVNINFDDLGDLGDVIGSMFGFGGNGPRRQKKGRDVETSLNIGFMEAFSGTEKELNLRMQAVCDACAGSGAQTGAKTVTCTECHGKGTIIRAQRTPFGTFQHSTACSACNGRGSKPDSACTECGGTGVRTQTKTMNVRIPPGIDDGETIRITGSGEAAPLGGSSGDLYVHVRVTKHPSFVRKGNDVYSDAYAPASMFMLGGKVDVDTLDGKVNLKVPSGTRSGTVFKLRGNGFPYLHGRGRGEHYVTLHPEVPSHLTREQKRALEQLRDAGL